MGIILRTSILGTVSGRVGNVVVVKWKDKTIIRREPKERWSKPREHEIRNRSNFAVAHHWLKPVIDFVRAGFNGYPEASHAFNAAKSVNLKNAFEGKPKVFNPALVQVSWGDLPMPENITVEKTGAKELTFSWEPSATKTHKYDQAMLLAYDPVKKYRKYQLTGQFRTTGSDKLLLDKKGNYHVYIAFVAADRTRQSMSQYLGCVEV